MLVFKNPSSKLGYSKDLTGFLWHDSHYSCNFCNIDNLRRLVLSQGKSKSFISEKFLFPAHIYFATTFPCIYIYIYIYIYIDVYIYSMCFYFSFNIHTCIFIYLYLID